MMTSRSVLGSAAIVREGERAGADHPQDHHDQQRREPTYASYHDKTSSEDGW
jgi:hypothetical protein